MNGEHRTSIESDFLADGWTARCSCGWSGEERKSNKAAFGDAVEHATGSRDPEAPR